MNYYQNPNYLTGNEAARLLGVSRKTVYRWIDQGRLSHPLTRTDIEARMPHKRQRGPKRNPYSVRYITGRHTYRPKREIQH